MAIPVILDDAKRQLRQPGEALDAERQTEIEGFIADAAAWVERYTGHILTARDVTEKFDGVTRLQLRAWPIRPDAAFTVSYSTDDGALVDIAMPRLNIGRRAAWVISPRAGWGSIPRASQISVTIRAGYGDDDAVPGNIRRAMLVLIAAYDADRAGGDVFQTAEATARKLCSDLRARAL